MPKRARSEDEENYSSLVKTHISEKEVNQGVLKDHNMKVVHDKTLSMLYRGTKNLKNNNVGSIPPPNSTQLTRPSMDLTSYRQLSLTTGSSVVSSLLSQSFCNSCVKPNCLGGQQCSSCLQTVGSTCVIKCEGCNLVCCRFCETIVNCETCFRTHCMSCTWH